jgi:hypothetical protein
MRGGFRLAVAAATLAAATSVAAAEPKIQLKVPPFLNATFPNFSVVTLPADGYAALEIWLEDALGEIQLSSVRVRLNEMPMTPFVALNRLPGGLRAVMKLGATLSPDYSLRPTGENVLALDASDAGKVTYRAMFYLKVDGTAAAPVVTTVRPAPRPEVAAPAVKLPPAIRFTSNWPTRTSEKSVLLTAEVADPEGLVRIVIEVNGKDVEEIQFENQIAIRKKDGFIARGTLAGEVSGDSRRLTFSIPVAIGKNISVIAVRAENLVGLRSRSDRVITRD